MSLTDIKKTLEKLTVDIDAIADPHVAAVQRTLFGLVEVLVEANKAQAKTIQQLKDEVNRLKGEQGKPDIRKQKQVLMRLIPSIHLKQIETSAPIKTTWQKPKRKHC